MMPPTPSFFARASTGSKSSVVLIPSMYDRGDSDLLGSGLQLAANFGEWAARSGAEDAKPVRGGHGLSQQFDQFLARAWGHSRKAGHVATRSRQARNQALLDRIGREDHDNGDRGGCLLRRQRLPGRGGDNDIHLRLHEVGDEAWQALGPALSDGQVDEKVLTLDVVQRTHRLHGVLPRSLPTGRGPERDEAESVHSLRLRRFHSGRRKTETDSENDHEPDHPHEYLGGG